MCLVLSVRLEIIHHVFLIFDIPRAFYVEEINFQATSTRDICFYVQVASLQKCCESYFKNLKKRNLHLPAVYFAVRSFEFFCTT